MGDDVRTVEKAIGSRRRLGAFDCVCIIVGIIIGSGLYETAPMVARSVADQRILLLAWALGGVLALVGALCYAELATTYPKHGGDYVYLSRAFGRRTGFLFAWMQFWIIGPATVGAMAFVFARYATALEGADSSQPRAMYACGAIVLLTIMNLLGMREGKWTQNALTTLKVAGAAALIAVGFFSSPPQKDVVPFGAVPNFGLAMILILFAYGGWSSIAYVAAEVVEPRKNILRSLIFGVFIVTAVYLLANGAFVHALSFEGLQMSSAVAADVAKRAAPAWGGGFISALICVTALGAINGQLLTESRVYYAWGREYRSLAWLGTWNRRRGAPLAALIAQGALTLVLMLALSRVGADVFQGLVTFAATPVWGFMLATGVAVFMLREMAPYRARPFRVPLYPATPILFCLSSAYMFVSSVDYTAKNQPVSSAVGMGVFGLGVVFAFLLRPRPGLGRQENRSKDEGGRMKDE